MRSARRARPRERPRPSTREAQAVHGCFSISAAPTGGRRQVCVPTLNFSRRCETVSRSLTFVSGSQLREDKNQTPHSVDAGGHTGETAPKDVGEAPRLLIHLARRLFPAVRKQGGLPLVPECSVTTHLRSTTQEPRTHRQPAGSSPHGPSDDRSGPGAVSPAASPPFLPRAGFLLNGQSNSDRMPDPFLGPALSFCVGRRP